MSSPFPDRALREQNYREFEDAHYHDEPEPVPMDDAEYSPEKALARKKAAMKLLRRRPYEED